MYTLLFSTVIFPSQNSLTAWGRIFHSASSMIRFCRISGVSPCLTSTAFHMTEMLKGVCIIVLIVCVCVMIYTIWNAINTAKRNKATDEASQKIFLAKMKQVQNANNSDASAAIAQKVLKQPLNIEPEKPKELNYDEYEDDSEEIVPSDKGLKDFFS